MESCTSRLIHALMLAMLVLLPTAPVASAQAADWDLPGGHFFTQTGGGGSSGYAVTDAGGIRFWSEFQRLGGVQAVGYPASQRFEWDGFTVQVFQRVVFQWRSEQNAVNFVNVFDRLHDLGKDQWLLDARQTPFPKTWNEPGFAWEQIVTNRLAAMDAYPAIKAKYFSAVGDPIQANGLPVSDVTDMGNHFALRAQRVVFQQWKQNVPWAAAGEVTVALGGDIAKETGVLPNPAALQPQPPPPAPMASGWSTLTTMPTGRSHLGVAAHANGKIYAIGGTNSTGLLDTVEELDPSANGGQGAWTTRQPMPTRRSGLAVVAHSNGKIYAIGGIDGPTGAIPISGCNPAGYSTKVEEFDPSTSGPGAWQTRTPIPGPRGNLTAASINNKIYVFGGQSGCYHGYGGVALEFDPAANSGMGSWTPLAGWPTSGVGPGSATTNGRVYLLGGYSLQGSSRHVLNGSTSTWTTLPNSMPTSASHIGVAAHSNGNVYAIGGMTGGISGPPPVFLDALQEWDPNANNGVGVWTVRAPMPLGPRYLLGAAHSNGAIYAIGGHSGVGGTPVLDRVERFVP